MLETPPSNVPDDDEDDTVQGVARRGERLRAEAQRLQDEQNAAAGMTPAEPGNEAPTETTTETPVEPPVEPRTPRKTPGA